MMRYVGILAAILLFIAFGFFQRRFGKRSCHTCHPEDEPKGCESCPSKPLESNHEVHQ